MSWFSREKSTALGIDIGTATIKLLELSQLDGLFRVESYALVSYLAQDAEIAKNMSNTDLIAESIKKAVKQSGAKTKQACVAVADSVVMTKIISLPSSYTDDEIEDQMWVEAEQYVPYPLDEINIDFEVQGETVDQPEMLNILLVASRRENIDNRVEILEKAGLKTKIVDVEAFAIENAFFLLSNQLAGTIHTQTIAIVDVGASVFTLNVLHHCRTIYTREQSFGGGQLTAEIQRQYGLSYEAADLAKKQGGLPNNYLSELLNPFKQTISQQIARSLQFYISSNANKEIDSMVLAGGCAAIVGLDKLIEQNLGLPTYIANPFIKMTWSNKINPQNLSHNAPALMTACGLALRRFD